MNNREPESTFEHYWNESRRPLTSLVFVLPFVLAYDAGVILAGSGQIRSGAEVWLRQLLQLLGFSQLFFLPVLVIGILLAWHYVTQQPWRIRSWVPAAMVVESLLLAAFLRTGFYLNRVFFPPNPTVAAGVIGSRTIGVFVCYIGAGVYEELLFRLILLPVIGWLLREFNLGRYRMAVAVLLTSLLFSLAHHIGPLGEPILPFDRQFWFVFTFRFAAGVFFAVLFLLRGFGIAVGTHVFYDIWVGLAELLAA